MGKGSGVFCAMLFSCLLLTGCAENPTEDIVVNKNEGKLEQAIQRENKKDSDTSVPENIRISFRQMGKNRGICGCECYGTGRKQTGSESKTAFDYGRRSKAVGGCAV